MKLTMGDGATIEIEIEPGAEIARVRYRSDTHGRDSLVLADDVEAWARGLLHVAGWLRAIAGQPAPTPGDGDVWAELIEREHDPTLRPLFAARRQLGIDRYGTPLQRNNGRDTLQDALDEALDLYVYASSLDRRTRGETPALARIAIRDLLRAMRERASRDELADTLP